MVDTAHISLTNLIGTNGLRRRGGQWQGACPFCGGRDRFYISERENYWGCRKCSPGRSDALTFVARRDNLNLRDRDDLKRAYDALRLEWRERPVRRKQQNTPEPEHPVGDLNTDYDCFSADYQRAADHFITQTTDALYSNTGAAAFRYLTETRRLDPAVIASEQLGYNAEPLSVMWGDTPIYAPRGVVIPWTWEETVWRIRFRLSDGYKQVAGAANGLYIPRRIHTRSIVVLVEGEFDALSLISALVRWTRRTGYPSHNVVGVATGGTTQGRVLRHIVRLSLARRVLVAFDRDENGAGEIASRWWLERLPNAVRWHPTRHDVNDMVIAGDDLARWVQGGLAA